MHIIKLKVKEDGEMMIEWENIIKFIKIIIDIIPWVLSLTALHQFLYYKYPQYYFFFAKRISKWRDTKWKLTLQFQLNREVDFFRVFEQVLSELYPNKRRLFNLRNKKQYEFGDFSLTVQYDLDVSKGETVSVDLFFGNMTVTLNTAKDKLQELRRLFNKLGQKIPIQDPNFNLKIFFTKVKNPFYGLMIQRLGEEHVKYFECQFPISVLSRKEFNQRDEKDLELVVYKDYISINNSEFDLIEEIANKCLLLE
jgi:hypothetical protein